MAGGQWQQAARAAIDGAMREAQVPGVLVVRHDLATGARESLAVGTDGAGRPLSAGMLFPVASITKLATALCVLRLVDRGELDLDDPLWRHLPESEVGKAGAILRQALSHTSGLPFDLAGRSVRYDAELTWETVGEAVLAAAPDAAPGERVEYSNLGPAIAALVVERVTHRRFPEALQELVLQPLCIEGYLGTEPPREVAHIAGKYGRHQGTPTEPFNSPFWRSLALPYGGLVTHAAGCLALALAFAGDPPEFLGEGLRRQAVVDQTGGVGGRMMGILHGHPFPWGLGPHLRGRVQPHFAPPEASPGSFGHAGATGCVVWLDQAAGVAWLIAGSRTFDAWWWHWPAIGRAVLEA